MTAVQTATLKSKNSLRLSKLWRSNLRLLQQQPKLPVVPGSHYFPVVLVAAVAVAVAVGAAGVVGAEPAGTDVAGVVAETEGPSVAADVDIGDEAGLLLQGSH